MQLKKSITTTFVLSQIATALLAMAPITASAHGSMIDPPSRNYNCNANDSVEYPRTIGCQNAVKYGGKPMLYNWMGVAQMGANSNHQKVVPNGRLCAGGDASWAKGLDIPPKDTKWAATSIKPAADGTATFKYQQTAPHATKYFKTYISKDSYDGSRTLHWEDLVQIGDSGAKPGERMTELKVKIPSGMTGPRVIYNVWQRSDSAEAFYSCSDVEIVAANIQWKPIRAVPGHLVEPGTKITLRVFDMARGADKESHSITVTSAQAQPEEWLYALAQKVNSKSQIVNMGKLVGNKVEPQRSSTENTLYGNGQEYDFAVDMETPEPPPPGGGDVPIAKIMGASEAKAGERVTLSTASSTGKNLKTQWKYSNSLAVTPIDELLIFVAPELKQDQRFTFEAIVSNDKGKDTAKHTVLIKAKDNNGGGNNGNSSTWNKTIEYKQACTKVSHNGKVWLNGWWTTGIEPGSEGAWGVWRQEGSKEMHAQCK